MLTPGGRIRAIRDIADRMAMWDWPDIDLTLQQFQLPWSDMWRGNDQRSYVVDMLRDASDDGLTGLLTFLRDEESATAAPVPEEQQLPWKAGYFRLFGSHLWNDREFVTQVKRNLAQYAIDLFVAHEDIEPSKEWIDELELALASCDASAAFLTPQYHESEWTDQEVGMAIRSRVLIIPICLGAMPYGFMSRYQGLKALGTSAGELSKQLFDVLVSNPATAGRMAEAITAYIADADSFARANRGSELIRDVRAWTPALLRRLEESIEKNSQVHGAFNAPSRIRALEDARSKVHGFYAGLGMGVE